MDFKRFKRTMKKDQEILKEPDPHEGGLIYHKFLCDLVNAVRTGSAKNFTVNDYVENINVLQARFGGFVVELEQFQSGGNEEAEKVRTGLVNALHDMLDVLEGLKTLPDNPDDPAYDEMLELFKQASLVVLGVNQDMQEIARKAEFDKA